MQKIEVSDPKTGKLVKKNEMGEPKVGNIGVVRRLVRAIETMQEIETGDMKVRELVKKIQMHKSKVGKVGLRTDRQVQISCGQVL